MMILLLSAFIATVIFLMLAFLFLHSSGEARGIKKRLGEYAGNQSKHDLSTDRAEELKKTPFLQRTVGKLISNIAATFSYFTPSAIPKLMQHRIMLAGKRGIWHVRPMAGIWFLCMVAGGGIAFRYAANENRTFISGLLTIWIGMIIGGLIPFGVLNHIIRRRQDLITRQLPDVLDLLSISVQAGLSFDGALKKVVERMEGPLIDEFRWMLRDIRMGMTRARSMKFMAERCDIQDIYLFVMSVTQSEKLGASMSDTLKIQADNMRNIRRQRARTLAMKAPVKMVFPLVFCIFPSIFVVVLLPSLLSLKQTIG